jgi:hypothetical protein
MVTICNLYQEKLENALTIDNLNTHDRNNLRLLLMFGFISRFPMQNNNVLRRRQPMAFTRITTHFINQHGHKEVIKVDSSNSLSS